MYQKNDCPCLSDPCSSIMPCGIDVCIERSDCNVRADVTVDRVRHVLIWGYVTDCSDCPVCGALVRLMKYIDCSVKNAQNFCHTRTDNSGYYQFELDGNCAGRYRVVVSQTCRDGCPPEPVPCPCNLPSHVACRPCRQQNFACRSTSRNSIQYY